MEALVWLHMSFWTVYELLTYNFIIFISPIYRVSYSYGVSEITKEK